MRNLGAITLSDVPLSKIPVPIYDGDPGWL